jgi:hypothetical protein
VLLIEDLLVVPVGGGDPVGHRWNCVFKDIMFRMEMHPHSPIPVSHLVAHRRIT